MAALGGALPSIRNMYRAAPGHRLVHGDYSQLELRVRRFVMHDDVLGQHLASGDVYSANAVNWFGLKIAAIKKEVEAYPNGKAFRKAAKAVHLAKQYAAGDGAVYSQCLAQDRGFRWDMVRRLSQAFNTTYHATAAFWHTEWEAVQKCGYSESRILGRRRYYPRTPPITEAANFPVQATASDIANLAMLRLRKELKARFGWKNAHIIIQLHDAFDVECRQEITSDVIQTMRDCMEQEYEIEGQKCQFPVEIKSATYWSHV